MLGHKEENARFNNVNTANISLGCRKGNTSRKAFLEAFLLLRHQHFLWSELLKLISALNDLFTYCHRICSLKSKMQNNLLLNCIECNLVLNL